MITAGTMFVVIMSVMMAIGFVLLVAFIYVVLYLSQHSRVGYTPSSMGEIDQMLAPFFASNEIVPLCERCGYLKGKHCPPYPHICYLDVETNKLKALV